MAKSKFSKDEVEKIEKLIEKVKKVIENAPIGTDETEKKEWFHLIIY